MGKKYGGLLRQICSGCIIGLCIFMVGCEKRNTIDKSIIPLKDLAKYEIENKISYVVYDDFGGSIEGEAIQEADGTYTTAVEAIPDLGYRFLAWSDGETSPKREMDKSKKTKVFAAVFEYDFFELPVISLTTETNSDVNSKESYILGTISILNVPEEYVKDHEPIKVRGRGNYTWTLDKKSYKIKLDEADNLLGLGEGKDKEWCLLANHCDQSLLRNYLTHYLSRGLDGIKWAPDCTNVEVYLNGEYRGVYLLCETVKVDKNRVKIENKKEEGTDIGYLLQMTNNSDEQIHINIDRMNYDIKTELSENLELRRSQVNYIKNYIKDCRNAILKGNEDEIANMIDIDSFVDTYIVEEFVKNLDVGYDSFYLYKDKGGKLCAGPIWDFDLALGNSNEHECELPEGLYVAYNYCDHFHSNSWYTMLMQNEWFQKKVVDRWNNEKVKELFASISSVCEETAEQGLGSYQRNFEKWKIFGQTINRETKAITSLKTYEEHYKYLSKWIKLRVDWLNSNL